MVNRTRRSIMFALGAASVVASLPIAAQSAPVLGGAVRWEIPSVEYMVSKICGDINRSDYWSSLAASMVIATWPAIELMAKKGDGVADNTLYARMTLLQNLDTFVAKFAGTPEATLVASYLKNVPTYVVGEPLTDDALTMHGYLVMQTVRIIHEFNPAPFGDCAVSPFEKIKV